MLNGKTHTKRKKGDSVVNRVCLPTKPGFSELCTRRPSENVYVTSFVFRLPAIWKQANPGLRKLHAGKRGNKKNRARKKGTECKNSIMGFVQDKHKHEKGLRQMGKCKKKKETTENCEWDYASQQKIRIFIRFSLLLLFSIGAGFARVFFVSRPTFWYAKQTTCNNLDPSKGVENFSYIFLPYNNWYVEIARATVTPIQ